MKNYHISVDLKFLVVISAENKSEAKKIVKTDFSEQYGIELTDKEITKIEIS